MEGGVRDHSVEEERRCEGPGGEKAPRMPCGALGVDSAVAEGPAALEELQLLPLE